MKLGRLQDPLLKIVDFLFGCSSADGCRGDTGRADEAEADGDQQKHMFRENRSVPVNLHT